MIAIQTVTDLCRHFLKPLLPVLDDAEITDIWRNGNGTVFVKTGGVKRQMNIQISEEMLEIACKQIGTLVGNAEFDRNHPVLDARLPDGSRVHAVWGSVSLPGIQLAIRKFQMDRFTLDELLRIGALEEWVYKWLLATVSARQSLLISGGTGSGKTTLMNALLEEVDETERLCIIEDPAELQVSLLDVVRFEARREQAGVTPVTVRDLVRACLRQMPDRIIVGEVRGGEAFDLMTAMSTGHDGSIGTIHGNSAADALDRLAVYCAMSGVPVPDRAMRQLIASSLDYVVHMDRHSRCVSEIVIVKEELDEYGQFRTEPWYSREKLRATA